VKILCRGIPSCGRPPPDCRQLCKPGMACRYVCCCFTWKRPRIGHVAQITPCWTSAVQGCTMR